MNARRFIVALLLVAPPLGAAAAGCSTNVSLGGLNPAPSPQCKGVPCGGMCTVDACGGADDGGCPASPLMGQCDMNGVCVISEGFACPDTPPPPCAGKSCGEACDPCSSGDPTTCSGGTPPGPFACDGNGSCVAGIVGCPGFDACEGVSCGMPCKAPPCFPGVDGGGCDMPPPAGVCDEMGSCVAPMGVTCVPPFDPCANKVCGQPCMHCPPMDPTCMEPPGPQACDPMGACMPMPVMCP